MISLIRWKMTCAVSSGTLVSAHSRAFIECTAPTELLGSALESEIFARVFTKGYPRVSRARLGFRGGFA